MVNSSALACSVVLDRLDELHELRSFPAAATRLVSACQKPDSSSKDLVNIIRCDPALAARLLKVANSSMYGCSGKIRTVDHATVVLGFRAVKNLALSMAGAEVFAQGETAQAEREALWDHSLACATVARLLARGVPDVIADEAFLAGVFHDVGKLVFYDLACEEYMALTNAFTSTSAPAARWSVEEERNRFGITHVQIGQQCGDGWGLTDEILHAISFHHEPDETPQYYELVALTGIADELSKLWQIGHSGDWTISDEVSAACDEVGLSDSVLDQMRDEAPAAFAEVRQACTV